jgi:hypothetical protein
VTADPSGWCSTAPLTGSQGGQQDPRGQAACAVGAAAPSRGARRGRRYLFVAGPVCRQCGSAGHEEAECSTDYCERCNLVRMLLHTTAAQHMHATSHPSLQ